jgi:RHS repeat-associated protein
VASYQYTLGTSGNRTGVTELSGRTVAYGYDNLYRLTSETIANDLSGMNGAMSYLYDTVGNRRQISSTLAAIAPGNWNYDANDRLTNDQNDADGNIVARAGIANAYDFENHLIQHGYMTFVYDGDGNRVAKTVGGVTTTYLVDTLNPTGYAQVLDELQSNTVARSYTWGLQLVSESQLVAATPPANPWQTSWYGLDGHGSVRYLTNSTGAVTDTYDYDAFGNLINSTGSTANNYLFAGEQFDPNLGLYYNRARYLDVQLGRFWGMDTSRGDIHDPLSLHRYLYSSANPVNRIDPSGNDDMLDLGMSMAIDSTLNGMVASTILGQGGGTAGSWLVRQLLPPDILSSLEHVTPDAMLVGGSLQVNTPSLYVPVSVDFGAGFEYVTSLNNGAHAWYRDWAVGAAWGGSGAGLSGSGYFGLIWACPDAAAYEGVGYTVSAPLGTLTQDGKLVSLLGGISSVPINSFASISWSPGLNSDGLRTFSVTVGVSPSYTSGSPSTQTLGSWSFARDSYLLLSNDVSFK